LAVIRALAKFLNVPIYDIEIIFGFKNRDKIIKIPNKVAFLLDDLKE